MRKLFLFDMDGTLTPARKSMKHDMLGQLKKLHNSGWEIGIISGSDMDYITQQCDVLFDLSPINASEIHFLPCNGTKYYKNRQKIWEYSMVEKLGESMMKQIMKTLIDYQYQIISLYDIPLTGNFIEMRGSVINWCPIGRNAMTKDRETWVELDKEKEIREVYIQQFMSKFLKEMITIKLGGETSFDIYPNGWNKTFPLTFEPFSQFDRIYFAGDRCGINGNDKELYDYLNAKENCRGFFINNVKETMEIIERIVQEEL